MSTVARRDAHLLHWTLDHPWAITRPMLSVIAGILARHLVGQETDDAAIAAALVNRKTLPQPRVGSIARIPIYGTLAPRVNMLSEFSGGTTYERLTSQVRGALADTAVRTILLDIDSPGGSTAGLTEFAREVMRARATKPVVAQIQFTGASAAYTIAAAATEIVAAPSARVGSVGVYLAHDDMSKAFAQMGVTRTYISAGEGKVDGNDTTPLDEGVTARMQAMVNETYDMVVTDIVRGRGQGTTAKQVRNDWKAWLYTAAEAKRIGMIDRIDSLDDTVARLLGSSPDEGDRQAAQQMTSPPADTPQEPSPATGQDRRAVHAAFERQLFDLHLDSL